MGRRILIFARDAVGDLINTTGAVHSVRNIFPDASITIEAGPNAKELFTGVEVWVRQRGGLAEKFKRTLRIRQGRFDLGIIFDNSHEAARLMRAAKVPRIVGCHKGKPELFSASVAYDPSGHDMFPILEGVLGLVEAGPYPGPMLPQSATASDSFQQSARIALHPSGTHPSKIWPAAAWASLIDELPQEATLVQGPGDERLIAEIRGLTRRAVEVETPDSLLGYAEFLRRQPLLVVGDTGPAHLAAAVNTPVLVLYGGTPPRRGHPWGNGWRALYHPSPCAHYEAGCAFPTPAGKCSAACIAQIGVQEVLEQIALICNPS